MATMLQVQANRSNARASTGPSSELGKKVASRNSIRHGILAGKALLDHEDPTEFDALLCDLETTLQPIGAVEMALVERIAIALWRQRRLVAAETAELRIDRRPMAIAKAVGNLEEPGIGWDIDTTILEPFDDEQRAWCISVIVEFETLEHVELAAVRSHAPNIFGQIARDAEDEGTTPEAMMSAREGGLVGYMMELVGWCRQQVTVADRRPGILELAEQMRTKKLILPLRQLEVIARYQSTLDNQLYKALRAFRDAQAWRLSGSRSPANDGE